VFREEVREGGDIRSVLDEAGQMPSGRCVWVNAVAAWSSCLGDAEQNEAAHRELTTSPGANTPKKDRGPIASDLAQAKKKKDEKKTNKGHYVLGQGYACGRCRAPLITKGHVLLCRILNERNLNWRS